MKIYIDSYYLDFLQPNTFIQFHDHTTIPSDVDIIAITFYTASLRQHQQIINQLLPKTKRLIVTLIEAVNYNLVDFLLLNNDPRIEFLVDSDLNVPVANAKTITSWFMCSTNFYVSSPQAKSLLDLLTPNIAKPKLFDCLLGTKKYHRDQVEKFYNNSAYRNRFVYSYYKDNLSLGQWSIDLPAHVSLSGDAVNYKGFECSLSALVPVDIYNQTHYSIVAETTALNTHNQYTEKLAKPILAQRLFVVFAGQHYLRNLKRKGFRTFDTVIDESYDSIEDADTRFAQAWEQVEYLCQQDPDRIRSSIESIVKHNQQHFLNSNWHENMMLTLKMPSGHDSLTS